MSSTVRRFITISTFGMGTLLAPSLSWGQSANPPESTLSNFSKQVNAAMSAYNGEEEVRSWTKQNLTDLIADYVHLHRNPELSFQEVETSRYVADAWERAGFQVTRNVGGHGVVAILENGTGPTLLLRTDLDGLPVTEQNDLPYASRKTATDAEGNTVGTMHACGHDIHMTSLIGAARYLAKHRDRWQGKLILIGQPAEERGAGARAMLDDRLLERFGRPDFAVALHCSATLPTGSVALKEGFAMANVDSIDITFRGRGGHGAYPHTTIDPVVMAARFIVDIQSIVSREVPPTEPAVVTVGAIQGGTKHNIISDSCHLQLTIRSYTDEVRQQLLESLERKARAAADSSGAPAPEFKVSEGTPALANDGPLAKRLRQVFVRELGAEQVGLAELQMGGEDFSHFGRSGIPSVMFQLGTIEPRQLALWNSQQQTPPSLHSPRYCPEPQGAIATGVSSLIWTALDLLPITEKPR